jgi:hypothetical protein
MHRGINFWFAIFILIDQKKLSNQPDFDASMHEVNQLSFLQLLALDHDTASLLLDRHYWKTTVASFSYSYSTQYSTE